MPLPLALFASSYNEDDESGTTLNQNSKASYIPSKNNYMLDGNGNSNNNNNNNNNNNDKHKNKNPPNMRKTIKQKPSAPNESKLSALLKSMDESSDSENENDDSHSNLVNYKGVSENNNNNNNNSSSMFPPLPELNYKGPSMMQSLSQAQSNSPSSHSSSPSSHTPDIPTSSTGAVSNSSYDNIPSTYANQYYKQFVPYMNQSSSEMPEQPKSELIEKLNYIIDILEEQQDYKTNSIFEDLILYAFLGIFVIFIVDSFSRSGKYVR